ncbi:P27 family phage terminase small subunit [Tsuneonella sp. HG249]
MTDALEPPAHLSTSAAAWWCEVLRDYSLEPHHIRLLQSACEAWDRKAQAQAELAAHGALTFTDARGTIRAHPAVAMERDARTAFARLVRELDLDTGAPGAASATPRPPALASNRR